MTDRSKSPRKRRLQLNAEDFAPPTDMHQAPDDPRIDDAWVQYYGGEKLGGIKRLTSIDEDLSDSNDLDSPESSKQALTSGTDNTSETQNRTSLSLIQQPEVHAKKPLEAPLEKQLQSAIVPIKELQRQEKPQTANATAIHSHIGVEIKHAPLTLQRDESKDVSLPKSEADTLLTPSNIGVTASSFESWSRRWTPWLKRGGSIKVCEAFFLMTHAQGKTECFTSNSEIMKRTELSRAQCIRNIHYLIEMGFLDELSEVNNSEAKGTYYRFNLIPKLLAD